MLTMQIQNEPLLHLILDSTKRDECHFLGRRKNRKKVTNETVFLNFGPWILVHVGVPIDFNCSGTWGPSV